MTRAVLAALLRIVAGDRSAAALTEAARRVGARVSMILSVLTAWLAAWVLWTFAGGLAVDHGMLTVYDGPFFILVALVGGVLQYRTYVRAGRQPALAILVGGQLVWLVVVLARNGLITF